MFTESHLIACETDKTNFFTDVTSIYNYEKTICMHKKCLLSNK